jgi:hypothetical protein
MPQTNLRYSKAILAQMKPPWLVPRMKALSIFRASKTLQGHDAGVPEGPVRNVVSSRRTVAEWLDGC